MVFFWSSAVIHARLSLRFDSYTAPAGYSLKWSSDQHLRQWCSSAVTRGTLLGFCRVNSGRSTHSTVNILLQQFRTQVTKLQVCLIHCYSIKNQASIYRCFWYVKNQFPLHSLVPISIPEALTTDTCLKLLVSSVTYFIPRARTENCASN